MDGITFIFRFADFSFGKGEKRPSSARGETLTDRKKIIKDIVAMTILEMVVVKCYMKSHDKIIRGSP